MMGVKCKITMNIDDYAEASRNAAPVYSSRGADKNKNITFWLKGNDLYIGACRYGNGITTVITTKMDATVEYLDDADHSGDTFFSIEYKAMDSIISMYNTLSRTKVTGFSLEIDDTLGIVTVVEDALDENFPNAELYHLESKFNVVVRKVGFDPAKTFLLLDFNKEGVEVSSELGLLYLDTLSALYNNTMSNSWQLCFGPKNGKAIVDISSGPKIIMPNMLDIEDVMLDEASAGLLRILFSKNESLPMAITDVYTDIKRTGKLIQINTPKVSAYMNVGFFPEKKVGVAEKLLETPTTASLVLDRAYLSDALKRASYNTDSAFFTANIVDGKGTFVIESQSVRQEIPVLNAQGTFNATWSEKPAVFGDYVQIGSGYWKSDICLSFADGTLPKTFFLKINSEQKAGDPESQLWACIRQSVPVKEGVDLISIRRQ